MVIFSSEHRLKLLEIKAGVDGFMVYDLKLIEPMQKASSGLGSAHSSSPEEANLLMAFVHLV